MNTISNIPSYQITAEEKALSNLLRQADIALGGHRPWDMHIHQSNVPARILSLGNLGLGESYMDGHWDVDQLDEFFNHILSAHLNQKIQPIRIVLLSLRARLFNLQSLKRAWKVGVAHYDIGNDFYASMLDSRMTYTCGFWQNGAQNLEQAQEAKLDLICRKLGLKPGMRLLDIGCGWGSLMGYAAKHYGVECVGVTISKEQADWASIRYAGLPLEFRLQDYRSLNEPFDRIASIGMFEHVGYKNYKTYMKVAHRCLKDDGLFLLHTIGKNQRITHTDAWIDKYIFPNGYLPSIGQIGDAIDGFFVAEDLHNFSADYDKTLMAWHANFEADWPKFKDQYGERFYRMWRYYLLLCAGVFRARDMQLWQWVLSKEGITGGYQRPNISKI